MRGSRSVLGDCERISTGLRRSCGDQHNYTGGEGTNGSQTLRVRSHDAVIKMPTVNDYLIFARVHTGISRPNDGRHRIVVLSEHFRLTRLKIPSAVSIAMLVTLGHETYCLTRLSSPPENPTFGDDPNVIARTAAGWGKLFVSGKFTVEENDRHSGRLRRPNEMM